MEKRKEEEKMTLNEFCYAWERKGTLHVVHNQHVNKFNEYFDNTNNVVIRINDAFKQTEVRPAFVLNLKNGACVVNGFLDATWLNTPITKFIIVDNDVIVFYE